MRFLLPGALLIAALAGGGCYSDDVAAGPGYAAAPGYGYAAPGYAAPGYGDPGMAYISPDVQVINDYDYPVFFSTGLYWRYDGGIWYSSRWRDRGWGVSYNVPMGIRGIDRPYAYAHYHGGGIYGRGGAYARGGAYGRGNVGAVHGGAPGHVEAVHSAPHSGAVHSAGGHSNHR
jgi:hypothetical protein